MAKAEVVSVAKAALIQAQDAALQAFGEACYDGGVADAGAPAPAGLTQADVDAAVAASKAADAQDKAAAVAEIQAQLDAMTQQDQIDKQALVDFKAKIAALLG